ncbi:HYC_CC_PP family protein [Flavobacterium sp.]|uniref:HYC_CC_PP family protein n=1 Tax=Flavobacterium sp. TaxID=239 RepID=UPI002B4B34A0|nr:hypothetical protein [Flavobacterium sp.]HLF51931.1 hypothetical protein [Flavobacterium sp.]
MKKYFTIMLLFLYLIPAIGVNMSAHYCGGELASVSHKFSENKPCSCSPKKMKKGCCEDKQQTLKMDNSQQKAELLSQKFNPSFQFQLTVPATFQIPVVFESIARVDYTLFHPPNLFKRPIYLLNSVLRI